MRRDIGSDLGDAWPIGLFVAYAPHKEALLWSQSPMQMGAGIEAGLYFRSIHASIYEHKIASLANRHVPRNLFFLIICKGWLLFHNSLEEVLAHCCHNIEWKMAPT